MRRAAPNTPRPRHTGLELDHVWDNDARAVVVRPPGASALGLVALQVWIGAGTGAERGDERGAAHFVEHLLFKPCPTQHGTLDLSGHIEGLGGDVNAFTSHDETVVYASVPARHAREALEVLLQCVFQPAFEPAEIETERGVILEEIAEYEDEHAAAVSDALLETLLEETPYGRPILGRRADVRALDARRLRRFHRRIYTGRRALLVATGDVSGVLVREVAGAVLSRLPSGPRVTTARCGPLPASRIVWQRAAVHESHIRLGWRGPALGRADTPAFDVLTAALGHGEASLLPTRVRRDEKLVSDVSVSGAPMRGAGSLMVSAQTVAGGEVLACEAIVETTRSLARGLLDDDALARAKAQILSAQAYRSETMEGLAHGVGYFVSSEGSLEAEQRYYDAVAEVDAAAVRRVAARWLERAPAVGVIRSERRRPSRQVTGLRRALLAQTATPKRRRERAAAWTEKGGVWALDLEKGPRLLVLPDARVPVASATLLWRGGTSLEEARTGGAAWLAASLLTRGTRWHTGDGLASRLDARAADVSGVVTRDFAGVRMDALAGDTAEVLDLALECALTPSFATEELEEERRVLLEELEGQADDLGLQVARRALRRAFGDHAYGRPVQGDLQSVARLSRAAVAAGWSAYADLTRAVLAVSGDVEPMRVAETVRRSLARLQDGVGAERGGRVPQAQRPPSWPVSNRAVTLRSDRRQQQAHVRMLFPGLPLLHADVPALRMLVTILGDSSGRLFTRLREEEGIAYSVGGRAVECVQAGYVSFGASTALAHRVCVVAAMRETVARVLADGVTERERLRAQHALAGDDARALQRRGRVAVELATLGALDRPWSERLSTPRRLAEVTASDLARVARRHLDLDRAVVVTSTSPK